MQRILTASQCPFRRRRTLRLPRCSSFLLQINSAPELELRNDRRGRLCGIRKTKNGRDGFFGHRVRLYRNTISVCTCPRGRISSAIRRSHRRRLVNWSTCSTSSRAHLTYTQPLNRPQGAFFKQRILRPPNLCASRIESQKRRVFRP